MKALVVYAHPNEKSFNRAILSTVTNSLEHKGAEFRIRNLYSQRFNPVLEQNDFDQFMAGRIPADVAKEQQNITWADTLIVIYPIWWWGMPAVLKGWFDKVFSQDFAYKHTPEGMQPLLTGKRALVLTTSGSTEEMWKDQELGIAVNKLMIQGIYGVVGIYDVIYKNFAGVPGSTEQERTAMLYEVKNIIDKL